MFDKAKPTKQELRKLATGIAAAGTLGDLIGALERAIETAVKSISFVDAGARRELSRTQLSLGVSNIYLKGLIAASDAYLAELKAKPAAKTPGKGKAAAKKASEKKPAAKGKTAPKGKTAAKAKAGAKTKAAKKAAKAAKA
jgi:hypothetical protein